MGGATKKRDSRKSLQQPGWITLDGGFAARQQLQFEIDVVRKILVHKAVVEMPGDRAFDANAAPPSPKHDGWPVRADRAP